MSLYLPALRGLFFKSQQPGPKVKMSHGPGDQSKKSIVRVQTFYFIKPIVNLFVLKYLCVPPLELFQVFIYSPQCWIPYFKESWGLWTDATSVNVTPRYFRFTPAYSTLECTRPPFPWPLIRLRSKINVLLGLHCSLIMNVYPNHWLLS